MRKTTVSALFSPFTLPLCPNRKMQVKIDGNRTKIKGDIEMKTVNSEARWCCIQ